MIRDLDNYATIDWPARIGQRDHHHVDLYQKCRILSSWTPMFGSDAADMDERDGSESHTDEGCALNLQMRLLMIVYDCEGGGVRHVGFGKVGERCRRCLWSDSIGWHCLILIALDVRLLLT